MWVVKGESEEPRRSDSQSSWRPPGCAAFPVRSLPRAGRSGGEREGERSRPLREGGACAGLAGRPKGPALHRPAKHRADFTPGFAGRWNPSLWILRLVYSHMAVFIGMGTGPELWYLRAIPDMRTHWEINSLGAALRRRAGVSGGWKTAHEPAVCASKPEISTLHQKDSRQAKGGISPPFPS